jgi:hypothetical protein
MADCGDLMDRFRRARAQTIIAEALERMDAVDAARP